MASRSVIVCISSSAAAVELSVDGTYGRDHDEVAAPVPVEPGAPDGLGAGVSAFLEGFGFADPAEAPVAPSVIHEYFLFDKPAA